MGDHNRLVIFDCDGTLVDSQHMIIGAMHATYEKLKLELESDQRVRSIVGLNLVEAMAKLRPADEADFHEHMAEVYKREFYRLRVEEAANPDPLYSGAREAMNSLRDEGYLLGVATGNSRRGLDRVIKEHDLDGYFVTLQTADGHPSKPHPSMIDTAVAEAGADIRDTVMVGDTSYDMMMARSAGCHGVGVNWGYHSDVELHGAGAHSVLTEFQELPPLVEVLRALND